MEALGYSSNRDLYDGAGTWSLPLHRLTGLIGPGTDRFALEALPLGAAGLCFLISVASACRTGNREDAPVS